ncbi:DUF4199 domain-containing protein [Pontibacter chitinilyticus]|uniref:DUF4199 domain-containing protein n=1 Tax=Pontibacter chitinilyticus TaxID=2674989 RepID=UPI003218DFD0
MEKIGLKYGILTAAGLILYFLLMDLLGLTHIVELRFLNGIIMALGVTLAIRALKIMNQGRLGYFKGLGTGAITAVSGSVLFAVFMILYIKIGDGEFLRALSVDNYFGQRLTTTPGLVIFIVVMLEGVISGLMVSFIAMQYFKTKDNKVPGSP